MTVCNRATMGCGFMIGYDHLAYHPNGSCKFNIFIQQNDERMHHYQRRRTSITGLVL